MKVPYLGLGWQAAGTRMVAKHSGGQAFFELLDANNFQLLAQAQVHTFYGGPMSGAEWEFEIPYDDNWYVAGAGDGQLQVDQLTPGMPPVTLEGTGASVLEGVVGETPDRVSGVQAGGESEAKSVEFQSGRAPRDVTVGMGGGLTRGPGREPPPLPPVTDNRRKAIEYADAWADGNNPKYKDFGVGKECTNFISQAMRAGMFQDTAPGIGDIRGGDRDDWYYQNHMLMNGGVDTVWGFKPWSDTWALAKANHDFITQHSGRGRIVGVQKIPSGPQQGQDGKPLPDKSALNPTALSDAGLIPGDIVYYKEGRHGDDPDEISHVAMFVGRDYFRNEKNEWVLTDLVDQHATPGLNHRNDWQPDSSLYTEGQVEFVHLTYPGE